MTKLRHQAADFCGTRDRVLLCFTCDPYSPVENGETREALKILKMHNIPFQVLTKGGLKPARDFDLYGENDAFAATLTLLDPELSLLQEPQAAMPKERLEALQAAHERGIQTWVSLEPVLDPETALEIIEVTHPYVDHYKLGKLNHAPERERQIDWRQYGIRAVQLCEKYGKTYYVKEDLQYHIRGIKFLNTDLRTI